MADSVNPQAWSIVARWRFAPGLLLASGLIAACDSGDDSSVRERQCKRFCESLELCSDETDLLDCQKHCAADEVRSDAYFRARALCAEQSCNLWVSEVDSQGDDICSGDECNLLRCINRKLAEEDVSEADEKACSTMATALYNCDGTLDRTALTSECERNTPLLAPGYREESQMCVQSICRDIGSCLDELADREGTDLKLFQSL